MSDQFPAPESRLPGFSLPATNSVPATPHGFPAISDRLPNETPSAPPVPSGDFSMADIQRLSVPVSAPIRKTIPARGGFVTVTLRGDAESSTEVFIEAMTLLSREKAADLPTLEFLLPPSEQGKPPEKLRITNQRYLLMLHICHLLSVPPTPMQSLHDWAIAAHKLGGMFLSEAFAFALEVTKIGETQIEQDITDAKNP